MLSDGGNSDRVRQALALFVFDERENEKKKSYRKPKQVILYQPWSDASNAAFTVVLKALDFVGRFQ